MDNVSAKDSDIAKIHAAALDYIGGVPEADAARMERALHPDLAKRACLARFGWQAATRAHVGPDLDERRRNRHG